MATLASSSSSSPRCVPFAFRRGGGERRARGLPAPPAGGAHATGPAAAGCGRPLCRTAEVVGGGIRGAFFASLDRCSCVEVRTKHDDSFKMVDAAEAAAPLMRHGRYSGGAASGVDDDTFAAAAAEVPRRWRSASSSSSAGKGGNKQRRGGLGCCDANSTRTVN